jgi:putative flippase GtrA
VALKWNKLLFFKNLISKKIIGHVFSYWLKIDERIKFTLVGGYNAFFSYLIFCFLQIILMNKLHYIAILIIVHFVSVFNSFLTFKFFVFHSNGKFWKEYFKINLTYLFYLFLNSSALFVLKEKMEIDIFISQLICIIFLAVLSYFAHKYFSFKNEKRSG